MEGEHTGLNPTPVGYCPTCQADGPCDKHCMRCGRELNHTVDMYWITRWLSTTNERVYVAGFCAPCWAVL